MRDRIVRYLQDNFQQDSDRRILWLPVLFALGIGIYFALSSEPSKWFILALIEGLIVLAVLFRRRIRILHILGLLAIVLAGFTVIQVKSIWLYSKPAEIPSETFYFKGQIAAVDINYQGRRRFILENIEDFKGNNYLGKYRVTQRSKKGNAKVGECVEMIGTISPLAKEVVVGGYQFDRKGYFEGLKGSGFAESRWFTTQCSQGSVQPRFKAFIANLRQKIVKHIKQVLPTEEASIASAIIAGEQGAVAERQYEKYRNSGLAHFLSISGLHMSMLAGLMFFLIRFILALVPTIALRIDTKKIAAVFAIIISLVYLFISGMAVPAQRAFIMTFVVLLGILTDRRAISMQTIALAAFLVLAISPEVLVSASFQMSFAAVLGLIAFYEKVSRRVQKFLNVGGMNKWGRGVLLYILGVVVSDLIASLMTLPFAVYHFNMIALYTTIGNFLAGPVIGLLIMPFVLLSMLLMPLGLDVPFLKIVGLGINLVNEITAWVSSLPHAGYQVPSMPHWGLMLIVFGGLWLMLWQARWRYWGWLGIIVGALSIGTAKVPDILIGTDMKAFAFKNKDGELEIASSRGGRFIKNVWKNKYPVSGRKTKLQQHPEIKIDGDVITIADQKYNIKEAVGMSVYYQGDGSTIVKTIREDIGRRLWNQ